LPRSNTRWPLRWRLPLLRRLTLPGVAAGLLLPAGTGPLPASARLLVAGGALLRTGASLLFAVAGLLPVGAGLLPARAALLFATVGLLSVFP
jgi:hypothetical protein